MNHIAKSVPAPPPYEKLDDGWEIYDRDEPIAGIRYGRQHVRTTIVGLGSGELLVYSPGTLATDAQWSRLSALGTPAVLLTPNHFHNLGLAEWHRRFPHARVVADPRALPRLRTRIAAVPVEALDENDAAFAPRVRLLRPPSTKQGETCLVVQTASRVAWIVGDCLVNERRLPSGPIGWLMWIAGFRTELMTNPFFKRWFLRDKRAYKAWMLEAIEEHKPTLLIPCHGAPISAPDLPDQLARAVRAA